MLFWPDRWLDIWFSTMLSPSKLLLFWCFSGLVEVCSITSWSHYVILLHTAPKQIMDVLWRLDRTVSSCVAISMQDVYKVIASVNKLHNAIYNAFWRHISEFVDCRISSICVSFLVLFIRVFVSQFFVMVLSTFLVWRLPVWSADRVFRTQSWSTISMLYDISTDWNQLMWHQFVVQSILHSLFGRGFKGRLIDVEILAGGK